MGCCRGDKKVSLLGCEPTRPSHGFFLSAEYSPSFIDIYHTGLFVDVRRDKYLPTVILLPHPP